MSNTSTLSDASPVNTITSSDLQQAYVDYQLSTQMAEKQHQQLINNALTSLSKAQTLLDSLESREAHRKAILLKLHRMVQKWQKSWNKKIEEEKKFFDLAQKAILSDINDTAEQEMIGHDEAENTAATTNPQPQPVHDETIQHKRDDSPEFSDIHDHESRKTKPREAEEQPG